MSSVRHRDIWQRGLNFLPEATRGLSGLGFDAISNWPDWPAVPAIDLLVPAELSSVRFTVMKDTQPDGSIRVAIQMYRYRFLGLGAMRADGFLIAPGDNLRWFTERDTWEVT